MIKCFSRPSPPFSTFSYYTTTHRIAKLLTPQRGNVVMLHVRLTKLCLHLYTNSQVWQVCLHLYTSWTQMQGTEIVCVCVSTKYRRSSLLSWQHHHFNFATKKENSRLLPRIWEPGTNIQTGSNRIKQDRHGMTWIWINTNKQIFPTLVCARVTLQCDRHCCCVSSIVGNLLGTIDLLGKPLRWIKISWLQWMNKHQCLRSPVLSILFCVCFFACLWICFVWCDIAACMFLSLRRIKLDTEHLKNPREWKREISSKPLLNNPTAVATFLLASSCSHHDVDAIFGTMAVVSTPGGASSSTTGSLHVQGAILDV